MQFTYGSICSGIEAASVAWHGLGKPLWFSEIEPFPCAVLAHRFPDVPNLGDMTALPEKILNGEIPAPDILVGGTPCQAFSVAGKRESLDDDRGNLTLTLIHILEAIDYVRQQNGQPPCVLVWENVPGVLSTKDNAFGHFLAGLVQEREPLQPAGGKWTNAGYVHSARTVAWRVLDAQYFGVAQRRKRVFLVASARGRSVAQILIEPKSVRGDIETSRNEGQSVTGFIESSFGTYRQSDKGGTVKASGGALSGGSETLVVHGTQDPIISQNKAHCLGRNNGQENMLFEVKGAEAVRISEIQDKTPTLKARMGTGGNNIPCMLLDKEEIYASQEKRHSIETLCLLRGKVGEEAFTKWGFRILNSFFKEEILQSPMYGKIIRSASFRKCGLEYSTLPRKKNHSARKMLSLRKRECQRCSSQRWELPKQFSGEFGAYLSELSQQATPKENLLQDMWQASKGIRILQQTLHQIQEIRRSKYVSRQTIIRKLSVIECERLQGFSDDWTKIPYRNKSAEDCPDSPRYKAIGNSMAVPCMRWIGQRLNDYLTQSL